MSAEQEALELKPFPQYAERGIPLLRRVWEEIKADQSAWDQTTWFAIPMELPRSTLDYIAEYEVIPWDCGTAACLAGHAVFATGAKLPPGTVRWVTQNQRIGKTYNGDTVILPNGDVVDVGEHAAELYGLDTNQAESVFCWRNQADHIERMISALEENPGALLECGCGPEGHGSDPEEDDD